jgi:hypothetical protein
MDFTHQVPAPVPLFERYNSVVLVERASVDSSDWVTVVERLRCRLYYRNQVIGDATWATLAVVGSFKLQCEWSDVYVAGDADHTVQPGDRVSCNPVQYKGSGGPFSFTVRNVVDPSRLGYAALIELDIRGQTEH